MPYNEQAWRRGLEIKDTAKKYLEKVFFNGALNDDQYELCDEQDDFDGLPSVNYKNKIDEIVDEIHRPLGECNSTQDFSQARERILKTYQGREPYAELAIHRVLGELLWDSPSTKLTAFIIPPSVTKIGQNALVNCEHLLYLVVPQTVTKIHPKAFHVCPNLSVIVYCGSCEGWLRMYRGCPLMCDVHCTDGYLKFVV